VFFCQEWRKTPAPPNPRGLLKFVVFLRTKVSPMNKFKMSQIRNKSAVYYAVGIAVFSGFFFVVAVIAELVSRNS
jgi:hypothetical protein